MKKTTLHVALPEDLPPEVFSSKRGAKEYAKSLKRDCGIYEASIFTDETLNISYKERREWSI